MKLAQYVAFLLCLSLSASDKGAFTRVGLVSMEDCLGANNACIIRYRKGHNLSLQILICAEFRSLWLRCAPGQSFV